MSSKFEGSAGISFTGLEAWYKDHWISVPHIPGSIILNQGEMLSRISGGKFLKAPVHRVRANTERQERYSLVGFWGPNYEYLIPDGEDGEKILTGEYYLKRNALLL